MKLSLKLFALLLLMNANISLEGKSPSLSLNSAQAGTQPTDVPSCGDEDEEEEEDPWPEQEPELDPEVIEVTGTRIDTQVDLAYQGVSYEDEPEIDYGESPEDDSDNSNELTEKEREKQCIRDAKISNNHCLGIVGTGAVVGTAMSTACGPLLAACLAVVGLEVTAGTVVCNNALAEAEYQCSL